MENHSTKTAFSSRQSLVSFWPWLAVLIVLLCVGFIRYRLLDMPLERDEGEYAYAGQLILQGIPPYQLAYNMKLPGTYYACALGMAVFGQTIAGIHLTLLAANSLTIIFVFLLGRRLFGVTAGLAACASFGILSVSPAVVGMAAHANHFVILFAVPATLLLWKAAESDRLGTLFFSGLLYGLAFLMKQQGACFCLFGCFFLAARELRKGSLVRADVVKRFFCFGAGMLLPFALTCLFLAWAGVFSRFWFWIFTYAGAYASHEPLGEGIKHLCAYFQEQQEVYLGFLVLAAAGLPLALVHKAILNRVIFGIGFLFFSFLGTTAGLYFRAHYFILVLPAFAVVVGLAAASLQHALKSPTAKIIPLALLAAVLGWNLFLQRGFFFQWSALQVCRFVYGANPMVESQIAAQYIREHSAEDARVAVVGSEPQIYFYSHRHSATGYIYAYPLVEERQPYAAKMQREMIREIDSTRPEFIVLVLYRYSWLFKDSSDTTILGWAKKYSEEFYEITGVINTSSGGEMTCLWGDAAKNYRGPFDQFLVVYKRKTVPAANPSTHNGAAH
jgi:hypothetical protein